MFAVRGAVRQKQACKFFASLSAPEASVHEDKTMTNWIVCAWYTPDYSKWAKGLIESALAANAPYDVVCVPKLAGGWEANTCQKAAQLLAAMDRNPGKVIVFVDADAVVAGDLSPLADIRGDIGFAPWQKYRAGQSWMQPQSGTIVVRPTTNARRLVETWQTKSAGRQFGENDQSTLVRALNGTPGVTVQLLEERWCARVGYPHSPAIIHDAASDEHPKIRNFQRFLNAIGWRGPDFRYAAAKCRRAMVK